MIFWLCYTSDKDLSLHTGVPPLLIDEFCDLALPQDCLSNRIDLLSLTASLDTDQTDHAYTMPPFPRDIRLGQIKERVCRLLYSPRAFKDFDSQVLLNIRHLDDRIENWRLSIQSPQRPALISSSFFNSLGSRANDMRHVYLQLEYLYLMVVVHMAVRRFRAASTDISNIAEDRHRLIHSSVEISLEASRSIFGCLKAMINALSEEAFWYVTILSCFWYKFLVSTLLCHFDHFPDTHMRCRPVVRYATPAAITLVLNMLVHPLNEQGQHDLELLISASNLIRCMTTSSLTPSEVACIKDTNSFIMELVFLGTCAIRKASREETDHGT